MVVAIILLIINILWPGWGTMFSSCCDKGPCRCDVYCIGVAQFFLSGILIGWIWAIIHSIMMIKKAKK